MTYPMSPNLRLVCPFDDRAEKKNERKLLLQQRSDVGYPEERAQHIRHEAGEVEPTGVRQNQRDRQHESATQQSPLSR